MGGATSMCRRFRPRQRVHRVQPQPYHMTQPSTFASAPHPIRGHTKKTRSPPKLVGLATRTSCTSASKPNFSSRMDFDSRNRVGFICARIIGSVMRETWSR